ncbi:MAG: hypothetical protein AABX70_02490 [Nanoarchaeota archaeon]
MSDTNGHETMRISASVTGPHEPAQEGARSVLELVTEELDKKLKAQTGLDFEDSQLISQTFSVVVQPLEAVEGESGTRTGESEVDYLTALKQATNDGNLAYKISEVLVEAGRTVKVPYFTMSVNARALSKEEFLRQLEHGERKLQQRFPGRIAKRPESVVYQVHATTAQYNAQNFPTQLSPKKLLGMGRSESLDEAVDQARAKAGKRAGEIKSTVFEGSHVVKIYGSLTEAVEAPVESRAPPVGAAARAAVGTAGVTTSSRPPVHSPSPSYRSGRRHTEGSGAGHEAVGSPTSTYLI